MGHIQIWQHIDFHRKILKYFNVLQNQNSSVLWLKWTQTKEMEQNLYFFIEHFQIWQHIFFLSRNIKVFQWLLKSKFLSFMTTVNSNNGMEQNRILFHETFKSDIIFRWSQDVKYFNDFYNWHLSVLLQKWLQTSKVKWNETRWSKSNSIFPYLKWGSLFKWLLKFISR